MRGYPNWNQKVDSSFSSSSKNWQRRMSTITSEDIKNFLFKVCQIIYSSRALGDSLALSWSQERSEQRPRDKLLLEMTQRIPEDLKSSIVNGPFKAIYLDIVFRQRAASEAVLERWVIHCDSMRSQTGGERGLKRMISLLRSIYGISRILPASKFVSEIRMEGPASTRAHSIHIQTFESLNDARMLPESSSTWSFSPIFTTLGEISVSVTYMTSLHSLSVPHTDVQPVGITNSYRIAFDNQSARQSPSSLLNPTPPREMLSENHVVVPLISNRRSLRPSIGNEARSVGSPGSPGVFGELSWMLSRRNMDHDFDQDLQGYSGNGESVLGAMISELARAPPLDMFSEEDVAAGSSSIRQVPVQDLINRTHAIVQTFSQNSHGF